MKAMSTAKWDPIFLKSMSYKSDTIADDVIKNIVLEDDFKDLRNLFMSLKDNNDVANDGKVDSVVSDYFNTNNELPLWANNSQIEIGQSIYARFGPQISLILNFYALPLCYTCKNGAKVLASTGRLSGTDKDVSRTFRRLFETSKIVLDTMSVGGLFPDGAGIVTAKKVRLYHAAIRYFLMHEKYNPNGWDIEEYGLPINQEEMAGTLMSFSALVLDGLEQLGTNLTDEEKDAYIHIWNIVGYFLGVDDTLLPKNHKEAWDLGVAIIRRNHHSSEDCDVLMKSLIDFSTHLFQRSIFEGFLLKKMPYFLITFFSKKVSNEINVDLSKILGVNINIGTWGRFKGFFFISIMRIVSKLENKSSLFRKIYTNISQRFLNEMIKFYLKTYHADFYIPASLKESWKMKG